jgi:hypothetical protein
MATKSESVFTPKAGTNVFAKVNGQEIGPIYLVQIDGDQATLQAGEAYVIPVSDIIKQAP